MVGNNSISKGRVGNSKNAAKMPTGLYPAAQKLWTDTVTRWEMDDVAALTHLANACRSLTRLRQLEGVLEKEGTLILNRFRQPVAHPGHKLLAAESRNFREHMGALQLDIETIYAGDD